MSITDDFEEIMDYAHYWNWLPDWDIVKEIYQKFSESYSVLTPFAYSYLEELIRSTTSEYGQLIIDSSGKQAPRKVGVGLINLAISENRDNREYVNMLKNIKTYFETPKIANEENNSNNVAHGFMHPRFWSKEAFEQLIHYVSYISKYSKF